MKYNPDVHHRHSIRLKNFDYSSNGMYFITICSENRLNLFGNIVMEKDLISARMQLNEAGIMVETVFNELIKNYEEVTTEKYILMPDHFHCIICLDKNNMKSNTDTRFRAD